MPISILSAIFLSTLVVFIVLIGIVLLFLSHLRRQALRLGYASLREYLAAAPITDEQKRDAVSLALKGLITCLLGMLVPPFLLLGLFPLFYGLRKVAWTSMGLGLVDDADHPTT